MYPTLLNIGPLTLHTYGLFVAIGFIVGLLVITRLGKSRGIPSQQIIDMSFVILICALVGSRLLFVFLNFSYYLKNPVDIFKVWEGGLVFSGALLAVIAASIYFINKYKMSFWDYGDLMAPGVAIGQGIGRIGCLMAGCCYGKPTDSILGIVFNNKTCLAPLDIHLHPTQIYSSLSGFIIFGILIFINRAKGFKGQVFVWYLILHSVSRLFVERFRGDFRGSIAGSEMSVTQLVSLIVLFAGVACLMYLSSAKKNQE